VGFKDTKNSIFAFSNIGPVISFIPDQQFNNFVIESTLLISISDKDKMDMNLPFVGINSDYWITDFKANFELSQKWWLFTQFSPWITFTEDGRRTSTPIDIFLSYYPLSEIGFFIQNQVWPTFSGNQSVSNYFLMSGGGIKLNLLNNKLELSYNNFWMGKNSGAGETFNLGLKFYSN
ncbi:MAG: hypothetical protein ABEH43_10655, partial [Flavobacteriales bacterium]